MINKVRLSIPFFFLFFDYDLFVLVAILIIFIEFFVFKDSYLKLNINFLKSAVALFYLLKFFYAFFNIDVLWQKSSQTNYNTNAKFLDMQSFLFPIKCNSSSFSERYIEIIGSKSLYDCYSYSSYGPMDRVLKVNIDINLWTYMLSFLLILFFIKSIFEILNFNIEHAYFITLIALSPPVNFLIERMNIDIFIFLTIYYLVKNFYTKRILFAFVIFLLGLIKIYIISIYLGLLFLNIITKNFKDAIINFLSTLLLVFLYFQLGYFETDKYFSIRPARPDWSYGFLTEILKLEKLLTGNALYFVIFFIIFFTFMLIFRNDTLKIEENLFYNTSGWPFLFLFLGTSLYANYDYRLVILIFISQIFLDLINIRKKYIFLIFLFSHPGLLHGYNESFKLVENNHIFYLDLTFYIMFYFVIKDLITFSWHNLKL